MGARKKVITLKDRKKFKEGEEENDQNKEREENLGTQDSNSPPEETTKEENSEDKTTKQQLLKDKTSKVEKKKDETKKVETEKDETTKDEEIKEKVKEAETTKEEKTKEEAEGEDKEKEKKRGEEGKGENEGDVSQGQKRKKKKEDETKGEDQEIVWKRTVRKKTGFQFQKHGLCLTPSGKTPKNYQKSRQNGGSSSPVEDEIEMEDQFESEIGKDKEVGEMGEMDDCEKRTDKKLMGEIEEMEDCKRRTVKKLVGEINETEDCKKRTGSKLKGEMKEMEDCKKMTDKKLVGEMEEIEEMEDCKNKTINMDDSYEEVSIIGATKAPEPSFVEKSGTRNIITPLKNSNSIRNNMVAVVSVVKEDSKIKNGMMMSHEEDQERGSGVGPTNLSSAREEFEVQREVKSRFEKDIGKKKEGFEVQREVNVRFEKDKRKRKVECEVQREVNASFDKDEGKRKENEAQINATVEGRKENSIRNRGLLKATTGEKQQTNNSSERNTFLGSGEERRLLSKVQSDYSELLEKYNKLQKDKFDDITKVCEEQRQKLSSYSEAAQQLVSVYKNEINDLQAIIEDAEVETLQEKYTEMEKENRILLQTLENERSKVDLLETRCQELSTRCEDLENKYALSKERETSLAFFINADENLRRKQMDKEKGLAVHKRENLVQAGLALSLGKNLFQCEKVNDSPQKEINLNLPFGSPENSKTFTFVKKHPSFPNSDAALKTVTNQNTPKHAVFEKENSLPLLSTRPISNGFYRSPFFSMMSPVPSRPEMTKSYLKTKLQSREEKSNLKKKNNKFGNTFHERFEEKPLFSVNNNKVERDMVNMSPEMRLVSSSQVTNTVNDHQVPSFPLQITDGFDGEEMKNTCPENLTVSDQRRIGYKGVKERSLQMKDSFEPENEALRSRPIDSSFLLNWKEGLGEEISKNGREIEKYVHEMGEETTEIFRKDDNTVETSSNRTLFLSNGESLQFLGFEDEDEETGRKMLPFAFDENEGIDKEMEGVKEGEILLENNYCLKIENSLTLQKGVLDTNLPFPEKTKRFLENWFDMFSSLPRVVVRSISFDPREGPTKEITHLPSGFALEVGPATLASEEEEDEEILPENPEEETKELEVYCKTLNCGTLEDKLPSCLIDFSEDDGLSFSLSAASKVFTQLATIIESVVPTGISVDKL